MARASRRSIQDCQQSMPEALTASHDSSRLHNASFDCQKVIAVYWTAVVSTSALQGLAVAHPPT